MTRFINFTPKNSSSSKFGIIENDTITCITANNLKQLLQSGLEAEKTNETYQLSDVSYNSPVTDPEKVVCVGKNYIEHAIETGEGIPTEPLIFNKFPSSITGHDNPVYLPKIGATVDWEGELAVVIGKDGYNIKKENAMDYVAGYTIANDVSARDWQKKRNKGQWLLGKTFNTFCPLGPIFVSKDEIDNVQNLDIKTFVNDEVMQSSNTSKMAFPVDVIIEWVSQFCTLKVGDVILTGTPDGVGGFRNPPIFLKNGDVVRVQVENIGQLRNEFIDEP